MNTQKDHRPQPHVIGKIFEDYVREQIFVHGKYDLVESPYPFTTRQEHFPESALKPDFKFRDRQTGLEFYVEAKFRTPRPNNSPVRCSYPKQLSRYKFYGKECPTFLIIGVGGSPDRPEMISLIPIEMSYVELWMKRFKQFQIVANQMINPEILWSVHRCSLSQSTS